MLKCDRRRFHTKVLEPKGTKNRLWHHQSQILLQCQFLLSKYQTLFYPLVTRLDLFFLLWTPLLDYPQNFWSIVRKNFYLDMYILRDMEPAGASRGLCMNAISAMMQWGKVQNAQWVRNPWEEQSLRCPKKETSLGWAVPTSAQLKLDTNQLGFSYSPAGDA